MDAINEFAGKLASAIINPLLILIFGAGGVVFVWGLVGDLYAPNLQSPPNDER